MRSGARKMTGDYISIMKKTEPKLEYVALMASSAETGGLSGKADHVFSAETAWKLGKRIAQHAVYGNDAVAETIRAMRMTFGVDELVQRLNQGCQARYAGLSFIPEICDVKFSLNIELHRIWDEERPNSHWLSQYANGSLHYE